MTETLAIDGGRPVRDRVLPYGKQTVDESDIHAVVEVLRSDFLTTGPEVARFERAFAEAVGARHAVAVSSGTAALHAAVFAAGVSTGDEVVTTPMTFAASANCALYQGAAIRFADVHRDTLALDPQRLEQAMTDKTRAVIAVDYAGQPADLDEIQAVAARRGAVLIEDAAHALGARYRGRLVGAIATLTAFSLHPVKHITTGEGGVVTTDDDGLAARVQRFRNHGVSTDYRQREANGSWFYEMDDLGYNYRITDIQCALGRSQLEKADGWLERRRAIASRYEAAFADVPELECPRVRPDRESAWHLYPVRLNLDHLRVDRRAVFAALRAENIGVNVHYIPVPWHPYYQRLGYRRGDWPVAEAEYERLISLPMWPGIADSDADDTIEAVRKVLAAYRR